MPCCLFYCPLAFQRDPKPFKRVIVFRVSFQERFFFFKNNNSLQRELRLPVHSLTGIFPLALIRHVQELLIQNNLAKPPQILNTCYAEDALHAIQLMLEGG